MENAQTKALPWPPASKMDWPWSEDSPALGVTTSEGRYWPRISIVTISYNQGQFLEEAIRSVLLQRYPNLEYIVIDGGSTDGSADIIQKYQEKIAYWCSEPDRGPAAGLNKGFQRATGEIFGFLNADDFYLPGSFHKIANLFRIHSSADILCGDGYMNDVSGQSRKPIFSDSWSLWRLAHGTCVLVQQATFFRRDAFLQTNGFNEKHLTYWDAGLWADLGLAGAKFHHIREFFGVFRLHANSISINGRTRQFRRDSDLYFQRIMQRQRRASDYALELLLRFFKFCHHPHRTLGYKLFLHSIRKSQVAPVNARILTVGDRKLADGV